MNISDLSKSQLMSIFYKYPEWLCDNYPEFVAEYVPDFILKYRKDWMYKNKKNVFKKLKPEIYKNYKNSLKYKNNLDIKIPEIIQKLVEDSSNGNN